jgi:hypothetical protein
MTLSTVMTEPTIGDMIAKHAEIKAALEAAQEAFDAEWKPFKEGLRALENACGVMLQQQGLQNFKSDGFGTAYLRRGLKAKVDNRDAFLKYVIESDHWDMVDVGALIDPIKEHLDKYENPPPGIVVEPYVACSIRKG